MCLLNECCIFFNLGASASLLEVIALFLLLLLADCFPSHFSYPKVAALHCSDSAQLTPTVLLANWFMVPYGPILYQGWEKGSKYGSIL